MAVGLFGFKGDAWALFPGFGPVLSEKCQVHGKPIHPMRLKGIPLRFGTATRCLGRAFGVDARQSGFYYRADGLSCGIICIDASFLP